MTRASCSMAHFDMVYVTWGAINWLPDIARWAAVVGSLLKPGGYLYLAESHPAILCFEWIDGKIVPHYDWRTPHRASPSSADLATTYNGSPRELRNRRVYEWIHPLSDIINGLRSGRLAPRLAARACRAHLGAVSEHGRRRGRTLPAAGRFPATAFVVFAEGREGVMQFPPLAGRGRSSLLTRRVDRGERRSQALERIGVGGGRAAQRRSLDRQGSGPCASPRRSACPWPTYPPRPRRHW